MDDSVRPSESHTLNRDRLPVEPHFRQDKPGVFLSVVLCSTVAASYTAAAAASTHTQRVCKYNSSYMITYLNEAFLGLSSLVVLLFILPPLAELRRLVRFQLHWAMLFSPLALSANVAFTAALRLTSVASAVTLEQLTSIFIAGLSCCILKVRYRLRALPLLFVAVSGAILATLGDAHSQSFAEGTSPLIGDLLSLAVAFLAAVYMVLFKFIFPTMQPRELVFFLCLKAAVTIGVGWVIIVLFDALGWEHAQLPVGCALTWVPIGAALASIFNCSLIWTTLQISPLTARLSLLLAIPCSFLVDLLMNGIFSSLRLCGVILIFVGIFGFEWLSKQPKARTIELAEASNGE